MSDYGGETCQQLAGPPLDDLVSRWVLAALTPAALELSLAAATNVERERADLVRLWQQRLERAAYEAERAGRQYRHCEPEHRLVARQLERDWEAALATQQQLQEEFRRFEQHRLRLLSVAEQAAIRQLAHDIPALWAAETTTTAERKDLIRQVVERVVVDAAGSSELVRVRVTWAGGAQTTGELIRPVARLAQLSYYPQLCARLRVLASEGLSAAAIATQLNAEGYRPPKRREQFGRQGVQELLRAWACALRGPSPRPVMASVPTNGGWRRWRKRSECPSRPSKGGSGAAGCAPGSRSGPRAAGWSGRTRRKSPGCARATSILPAITPAGSGSPRGWIPRTASP